MVDITPKAPTALGNVTQPLADTIADTRRTFDAGVDQQQNFGDSEFARSQTHLFPDSDPSNKQLKNQQAQERSKEVAASRESALQLKAKLKDNILKARELGEKLLRQKNPERRQRLLAEAQELIKEAKKLDSKAAGLRQEERTAINDFQAEALKLEARTAPQPSKAAKDSSLVHRPEGLQSAAFAQAPIGDANKDRDRRAPKATDYNGLVAALKVEFYEDIRNVAQDLQNYINANAFFIGLAGLRPTADRISAQAELYKRTYDASFAVGNVKQDDLAVMNIAFLDILREFQANDLLKSVANGQIVGNDDFVSVIISAQQTVKSYDNYDKGNGGSEAQQALYGRFQGATKALTEAKNRNFAGDDALQLTIDFVNSYAGMQPLTDTNYKTLIREPAQKSSSAAAPAAESSLFRTFSSLASSLYRTSSAILPSQFRSTSVSSSQEASSTGVVKPSSVAPKKSQSASASASPHPKPSAIPKPMPNSDKQLTTGKKVAVGFGAAIGSLILAALAAAFAKKQNRGNVRVGAADLEMTANDGQNPLPGPEMNVTNPTAVIGERRSDVMQSAVVAKNSFGGAVAPDLAALRTGNALAAAGHALPKTLPPMSPSQQAKATAADTLEQTKKSSERGGKNGQKSGER